MPPRMLTHARFRIHTGATRASVGENALPSAPRACTVLEGTLHHHATGEFAGDATNRDQEARNRERGARNNTGRSAVASDAEERDSAPGHLRRPWFRD